MPEICNQHTTLFRTVLWDSFMRVLVATIQDIEAAAEEAMPEIRPGCCAAFAVTTSELSALVGPTPSGTPQPAEEEGAAIVAELREVPAGVTAGRGGVLTAGSVKGRETLSQLAAGVSRAVRIAHGVAPVLVALIPPKTVRQLGWLLSLTT